MPGRRRDPCTDYRVSIHTTNGYRYAATQPVTVDEETQHEKRRYIHWGTVSDDLVFTPNALYRTTPYEERVKLLFPAEWDISQAQFLNDRYHSGGSGKEEGEKEAAQDPISAPRRMTAREQFNNRLYGDIWLLCEIARKHHVTEDLRTVFDDDEMVNEILTLAIFSCVTRQDYSHVAAWQRYVRTPTDTVLTDSRIAGLSRRIRRDHATRFSELRIGRQSGKACIACDTAISSDDERLAPCYTQEKAGNELPRERVAVVYDSETREPVCYRTFGRGSGENPDGSAILRDLRAAGIPRITFLSDRQIAAEDDLRRLTQTGASFISGTRICQSPFHEYAAAIRYSSAGLPSDMLYDEDTKLYYIQTEYECPLPDGGKYPVKYNLFLDMNNRMEELRKHEEPVRAEHDCLIRLVPEGSPAAGTEDISGYRKDLLYHTLSFDTGNLKIAFAENAEAERVRKCAGFFGLLSYLVDGDALTILHTYRMLENQAEYFEIRKERMDSDAPDDSAELSKTGRDFIQFVGLLLESIVYGVWERNPTESCKSGSLVLDTMRPIRFVEYPDGTCRITPFTREQTDIAAAFGIAPPAECGTGCG